MAAKGWGKTDMQETLDRFEEDLSGGADFFQFKDGDNEVRICPAAEGERLPFFKRGQHWRVGDAEKVFNCPKAVDDDADCFLCDKVAELKKSDDDADVEKGEDLYAKRQWLYRIIDPANVRKGIQVMAVGIKTHKQIAKLMRDREYGDITDPENGINITIEKAGNSRYNTEYTVRPRRNPSDVLKVLEDHEPPDLATLCEAATTKQMKAAWNNDATASSGEKPKAAKSQRRDIDDDEPKSRRTRDDDDEPKARAKDDDDEPKSRAKDDDDDSPKRRTRDDDDDEPRRKREDDDDAPKGRRLSTKSRDED